MRPDRAYCGVIAGPDGHPPYDSGMDVSPQHLREVEFLEKWRGYSPDEVDELLERTATTVADLQTRLESAEERATSAERRVLETSDDDVRRALVLAQRTADAAVAEASEEAERRLADAEERMTRRPSVIGRVMAPLVGGHSA